ncbi:BamA/TamA family outer membrane protein [Shewanella acanthi]|uniref:BamA/TamA family outer membrane protein n=1 Tax=Shewanella acanthi TaxID=2864212 RepID=UPI001C6597F5|nr:BamA/TamA family outer membrane protein [Shewanella acanthi]QYJ77579.1 BamA/TamA family outer membrane protein [Shewanella acanthi]
MLNWKQVIGFIWASVGAVQLATAADEAPIVGQSLPREGEVAEPISTQTAITGTNSNSSKSVNPEFVAVPFIFATKMLSTAVGAAGVIKHAGQQQAVALGIGLYSSNDSWMSYLGFFNYQIPQLSQWLFALEGYRGHFQEGIYYLSLPDDNITNPGPDDTQRIVTVGDEAFYRLKMKYIVPWGHGRNGAVASLAPIKDSLTWNPLTSGVSSIQLTPFYRSQNLENFDELPDDAKGITLELNWDNRDSRLDSTRGGQTTLTLNRDFGDSNSASWTTWEFEQSAFLPLGDNSWFEQQVLAANFYLADTPTWNSGDDAMLHRPPSFAGVYLGGFRRLRGYTSKQFTGRSAVDYALEYRVRPHWQPLQHWPLFKLYNVPWWEWVVFAEVGNVTNEFNFSDLHQDMKSIYGVGARFEVEEIVVRTEFAFGGDESQVWVMVNQAF